jgi:hypothetical protein
MANDISLKIVIDGKEATAVITNLQGQLGGLERKGSDSGKGFGNSWSMALTGINQGMELVNKAMDFLSKPIEAAAQFEGYETSLKVMLGSTEAAKARLAELSDFAANTPFELPQVVELGNQLQAIGKYSKENMTNLGDLAAAAGKPIEQVTGAFAKLATGQKGVAVDMFRDLLISTTDWEKAVGKSIDKITSDEMMGKLPEIMKSKGFAGMMAEQSKTFSGMMSNFQDSIGALMRSLGEAILPFAKSVIGSITPIFQFLTNNIGALTTAIQIITPAAIAFGTAWAYNNLVMSASSATIIPRLIAGITSFGTALKTFVIANPVLLVVTALGAAVGALEAYSSRVKDVFNETGELYEQLKTSNDKFVDSMRKGTPEQIKQAIAQSELNKELAKTLMMKNTEANFTASAWESIKGTVMNVLKGESIAVASMTATIQNGVTDLNETGKKARDEYKAAEDRINKLNQLLKEKQAGTSTITAAAKIKTDEEKPEIKRDTKVSNIEIDGLKEELSIKRTLNFNSLVEGVRMKETFADEELRITREKAKAEQEIEEEKEQAKLNATRNSLGIGMGLFAKHTLAYKAMAVVQATIDTYKGVSAALGSAPPPFNFILAGITLAAGLVNVAQITGIAPPQTEGFAEGGILPAGKSGFIEGYYNEIIAPEKTFVDVMRSNIMPQLAFAGGGSQGGGLIDEIRSWKKEINFKFDGRDWTNTTQRQLDKKNKMRL